MKKRLSLLMAALMIVTMLPMSAFAAASAVYTTLDITADDEREVPVGVTFKIPNGQKLTAGKLRLELDNGAKFKPSQQNRELTAAELQRTGTAGTISVANAKSPADNIIFFELSGNDETVSKDDVAIVLNIPVIFPNEGDVNLRLIDESNTGIGTLSPAKIAVVKESSGSNLEIKVKDSEKMVSFDGGELSQFEIRNFDVKAGQELVVSLDDDSMAFVKPEAGPNPPKQAGITAFVDGTAKGTLSQDRRELTFATGDLQNGKVILVLPIVDRMGRKASEGSVRVNVAIRETAGDKKVVSSNSAIIGKVVDYKVTMTIVEKGKKEMPSVWGGEKVMVTVTLKGPKGSIYDRPIDFKVDGADVSYSEANAKLKPSGTAKLSGTKDKDNDKLFKDAEFEVINVTRDVEEVKFDIELHTSASKDGVATLTAAQRGWEVKADAVKVTPKLSIKSEEMPVKKGEARETANIVITEAKAGLLTRQDKLQIRFNTRRSYTQFATKAVKIEATNGMKFGDPAWKVIGDQEKFAAIEFPITKQSSGEAAVITISGVKVLVDGSSTDDVIKVYAALNGSNVANTEYIKVVKEYALESILTVFTIGQTQYTVNGQAKTAASAPYVKNGRTMLPVRALAESLGLHVQWNGQTKTATFTDSTKVAAVVIGAETMHINGTPVKLAAKAELVNGTTFIELRSLATAFGVQIDWDAAAKTATVSK